LINSINDFDVSVAPEISTNYAISLVDINTACSNVSSPDELAIQVHEVTLPTFSIQSSGCPGSTMPISEFIALNGTSYSWNVSPNAETIINTSNLISPSITFANEGLYTVEVTANDSQGCLTNSSIQNVSILSNLLLDSLSSSSVCIGGNPNQLCINYNNGPGASYFQWYEDINNDLIGGTPLLGETYSCFTPPSSNEGTYYYYATVLIDGGSCSGITSNAAEIKITSPPLISSQPISTQTICLSGSAATLSVSLQTLTGIGPFSYQWYSNTFASNTDGIPILDANSSSFTPSQFNSTGSYYFYCVIYDSANGCGSIISEVSSITVIEEPFISSQLTQIQTLCQNGNPEILEITAVGWDTFSYQWYVNDNNSYSGAIIIPNATLSSYLPQTNIVGTNYYFCVISIPNLNSCSLIYSNISALNVLLSAYIIAYTDSPQMVCIGGNTTNISFSVPDGFETPTYQWFSNINYQYSNATILSNETTSVFSPPSTSEGTIYYFCELLFSSNSACGTKNTPITQVTVYLDPSLLIQPLSSQTICEGGQNQIQTLTVSTIGQPAGVAYQWYRVPNMPCANGNSAQYTPNPNNSGLFNYYVEVYSTMEGCDILTSNNSELIIFPDPIISAEQNFSQTLCPFDEEIDAPTVLLDFDNSIGPPTYTWNKVEEGVLTPIANSNQNSYLPQLPLNGIFSSQCVIEFDYPGCSVLTSSLSNLTFDDNNLDCFPELVIPEAISPNNDGMNDYWIINGIELFNGYEINIFNSFGQSIYFVKNAAPNWDGTWNGRTLPNGDYFYSVKLDELNRTLFGTISVQK
jgi:gliding motility-associated-like protein